MVNMQLLSQIIFSNTAMLASIIIAFAGFVALASPVRAIVVEFSAFPIIAFIPSQVQRDPFSIAFTIAKLISWTFGMPIWKDKIIAAINTNNRYMISPPHWMIFSNYILRLPYSHTVLIAKEFLSFSNFTLNSLKRFITSFTLDSYKTSPPIRGIFCHEIFSVPFSSAFNVAKKMLGFLDFTRKAFDCLSAIITKAIDFLAPAAVLWSFLTFPVFFSPFGETNSITKMILFILKTGWVSAFYLFTAIIAIVMLIIVNNHFSFQKGVTPNISGFSTIENHARGDKNKLNKNPLSDFLWYLNYSMKRDYHA